MKHMLKWSLLVWCGAVMTAFPQSTTIPYTNNTLLISYDTKLLGVTGAKLLLLDLDHRIVSSSYTDSDFATLAWANAVSNLVVLSTNGLLRTNSVTSLGGIDIRQNGSGGITLSNTSTVIAGPAIVTNSIWVPAGAMAPGGSGSTAEGGRTGCTGAGQLTNTTSVMDVYGFDDSTNETVSFQWMPGPAFAGGFKTLLSWQTATPLTGASNITWEIAVQPLATNEAAGAFTYITNLSTRSFVSNKVEVAELPLITITNLTPNALLDVRISRLGTNTSNKLVGDAKLIGAQIRATFTNYLGGF